MSQSEEILDDENAGLKETSGVGAKRHVHNRDMGPWQRTR